MNLKEGLMMKKVLVIVLIAVAIAAVSVGSYYIWKNQSQKPEKYTGPVEKVRLGTSATGPDLSLLISVAEDQGYFGSNGLDVVDTSLPNSLKIQQELNSGELDLGVSTEFAYLTTILGANPLKAKIVATIDKGQTIKIIGRKDRGINQLADLAGKKIAVYKKTAQEYFLGTYFTANNLNLKDVQLVDLPPDKAKEAILAGDIDAAVMSEPYAHQTNKTLAENAVSWSVQGDTDFNWIVIGSNQFVSDHPKTLERFLTALVRAEEYVQKNPDKSQEILVKKFNLEQPYIVSVWSENKYSISLDQNLLNLMEAETRWSIANKLTTATEVPNYLNYISTDALKAVKPEAVTIY
jgi:NitT/TauT family transport system substrate-binding protein